MDRIRQRIGDNDTAKAQVQDETIAAYLAQGRSELQVAYRLCMDLAAKWARVSDVTLDDQMQRTSKIYDHYIALAKEILAETPKATTDSSSFAGIIVGGIGDRRGPIDPEYGCGFVVGIPRTGP